MENNTQNTEIEKALEELKLFRPIFYGKLTEEELMELIKILTPIHTSAKEEERERIKKKIEKIMRKDRTHTGFLTDMAILLSSLTKHK